MLRGKVGAATYSIGKDGAGKKQQIVRALPESVSNPQTIAQVLQRMKLAPAQKFYSALSEILSNSYQGVQYGEQSRLEFLRLAMSAEGPYVERGVDRFIPAAYQISSGSLPEVVLGDFNSGDTTLPTAVIATGAGVAGADFAAALGVDAESMITIITVTNNNGIFTPHYTPFDERFQLSQAPDGLFSLSAAATPTFIINPSAAGLETFRMVAAAVIISARDSSGGWLRSPQFMVLSTQLREQLYGAAAQDAAIASYQDTQAQNTINSDWYLNLGVNQAFTGRLVAMTLSTTDGGTVEAVVGLQQLNGSIVRTVFSATGAADYSERIYAVVDGEVTNFGTPTAEQVIEPARNRIADVAPWVDGMAEQLGIEEAPSILSFARVVPSQAALNAMIEDGSSPTEPIVALMSDGTARLIGEVDEDNDIVTLALTPDVDEEEKEITAIRAKFTPTPLVSTSKISQTYAREYYEGLPEKVIVADFSVNGNNLAYAGVQMFTDGSVSVGDTSPKLLEDSAMPVYGAYGWHPAE